MAGIDLIPLQINISNLIIYRNLHYCQKYSFGDILRKFDGNQTFAIDSVCLLSSMPKIGMLHDVLQMLRSGQNWEFVTLDSMVKIM